MLWPDQSRLRGGDRWGRRRDPGPRVLLARLLGFGPGWWECGVPSLPGQWELGAQHLQVPQGGPSGMSTATRNERLARLGQGLKGREPRGSRRRSGPEEGSTETCEWGRSWEEKGTVPFLPEIFKSAPSLGWGSPLQLPPLKDDSRTGAGLGARKSFLAWRLRAPPCSEGTMSCRVKRARSRMS